MWLFFLYMDTALTHTKYYRLTVHYLIIHFAQNFIYEDFILIENQLLIS